MKKCLSIDKSSCGTFKLTEIRTSQHGIDSLVHPVLKVEFLGDVLGVGPEAFVVAVVEGEEAAAEPVVVGPLERVLARQPGQVDVVLQDHDVSNLAGVHDESEVLL